jgi:hypothetical protein
LLIKKKGQFFVASPLRHYAVRWEKKNLHGFEIFYNSSLNVAQVNKLFTVIRRYDAKLRSSLIKETFYFCDNYNEALRMLGVDYKSDYNGRYAGALSAREDNRLVHVDGHFISSRGDFDPHDLWHSRLRNVLARDTINRPVDEGAAYLYGGSWGLSWETILEKFKLFAKTHSGADWFALYNESANFEDKTRYPLRVDFVINALFIRKIEKEQGIHAVLELISCGVKEKDNANYFSRLEKVTGISRSDFTMAVEKLIDE